MRIGGGLAVWRGHIQQVAFHQNYIGGFDGDVGAGADGVPVRRKGRGVVMPSPTMATSLPAPGERDLLLLVPRQHLGYNLFQANLPAYGFGGAAVVSVSI